MSIVPLVLPALLVVNATVTVEIDDRERVNARRGRSLNSRKDILMIDILNSISMKDSVV